MHEFAENEGETGFVKRYDNVLKTHQNAFRAVFERLGQEGREGGVLFHCTGSFTLLPPSMYLAKDVT